MGTHGQVRVSNELRKRGVFVSPSGVRSIWLLPCLRRAQGVAAIAAGRLRCRSLHC